MSDAQPILLAFWVGILTHLWQSTLVLAALALLSRGLRRAPARAAELLWSLGFLKLWLPMGLLGAVTLAAGERFDAVPAPLHILAPVRALLDPARHASAGAAHGTIPATLLGAVTALWIGGVAWSMARLLADLRAARRGLGGPIDALPDPLSGKLASLTRADGIPAGRVRITEGSVMPAVTGFLRPAIILPLRLVELLPREELRAILLHEDAHRRRFDPLRALVQRLIAGWFFFYPPLHWLLRRMHESAEFACDESALRRGVSPAVYARALARAMKLGFAPAALTSTLGDGGEGLIRRRLDRLSTSWRTVPMLRYRLILAGAAMLLIAGSLLPISVRAGNPAMPDTTIVPPVVIHQVPPAYPEDARKAGAEGKVLISVTIDVKGHVETAVPMQIVKDWPSFTEAAMKVAPEWRFKPAMKDGKPVAIEAVIPFQFKLAAEKAEPKG